MIVIVHNLLILLWVIFSTSELVLGGDHVTCLLHGPVMNSIIYVNIRIVITRHTHNGGGTPSCW